MKKKLCLSEKDKKIGGVCGGSFGYFLKRDKQNSMKI